MAYSDINLYINNLTSIAAEAIEMSNSFAEFTKNAGTAFAPPSTTITLPNIVLKDPTSDDLGSPPEQPTFSNISGIALPDTSKSTTTFTKPFPGVPPSYQPPTENTKFSEAYPETWLKDRVKASIYKLWNETGFESVEIDIWNRGNERNLQDLYDAEDLTIAKYSMSGWSMPNDIINRQLNELNNKYDSNRITVNADITAKMIDLAQKNAQFGIEQGLNGEAMLIAYFNRYADRALRAAKIAAGNAYDTLQAKVVAYNAYLKANEMNIKTSSQVEKELITEYNAILEVKAAELDAKLQNFTDTISAYKLLIGSYKTVISAQKTEGETEMSWRSVNLQKNLAQIKLALHTAITNMAGTNEATASRQYGIAADAKIKANDVAAILGEMQVGLNQAFQELTEA